LKRTILSLLLVLLAVSRALASDPEQAVFSSVEGAVNVDQPTGVQVRARKGDALRRKSMVATSNRGTALLKTTDGSETRIHPATAFVFEADHEGSQGDRQVLLQLRLGRLVAKVKGDLPDGSAYVIAVGALRFAALEKAEFSVHYNPRKERVVLEVLDGEVIAGPKRQGRTFGRGERATYVKGVLQRTRKAGESGAP